MRFMGSSNAPVIKTAQQGSGLGGLNSHEPTRRENCDGSTALTDVPSLQRHHLTPRCARYKILGHLFGNAEHQFATAHFCPDVFRAHAGMNPKHNEIVEQIRAFFYDSFGLARKS